MPATIKVSRKTLREAQLADHNALYRKVIGPSYPSSTFVPGVGDTTSKIMLIGEAPGEKEDAEGVPFVGPAGEVLDQMLEWMGMERDDIYLTNLLKYRPPNNRDPLGDEVPVNTYMMEREIRIIAPDIVIPLGRFASMVYFPRPVMEALSGFIHTKHGRLVLPLYHPAALLWARDKKAMRKEFKHHCEQVKIAQERVLNEAPLKLPPKLRRIFSDADV